MHSRLLLWIRTMNMPHSFLFCSLWSLEKVSGKKKSGQLQRKVGKFGQTAKVIICVCILDHNVTDDRNDIFD
jgi:hypothetical protein